jgi:hypothetical protein
MTTNRVYAALLALPLVALASAAHARSYGSQGAQVEAPPWSFACMKDTGPTQCGEPMWVYGSTR